MSHTTKTKPVLNNVISRTLKTVHGMYKSWISYGCFGNECNEFFFFFVTSNIKKLHGIFALIPIIISMPKRTFFKFKVSKSISIEKNLSRKTKESRCDSMTQGHQIFNKNIRVYKEVLKWF